jgi:hypothetical protein
MATPQESLRTDQDVSSSHAADLRISREKTLTVAALLALAEGYLDAYSWITHRVFANAQSANMLFLWIQAMAGTKACSLLLQGALIRGLSGAPWCSPRSWRPSVSVPQWVPM